MLEIKQRKTQLRRQLREARRAVSAAQAAAAAESAASLLARSPLWRKCGRVALYLPNDGELDTAPIAAIAAHRTLFLPRVQDDTLAFAPWQPGASLRPNRFGIGEPTSPSVETPSLDLLILPLVGFNDTGRRLGMGGGYYDRCLGAITAEQRPWLVGLGYARQRSDELPGERWDIGLDAVLTEEALHSCSEKCRAFLETQDKT